MDTRTAGRTILRITQALEAAEAGEDALAVEAGAEEAIGGGGAEEGEAVVGEAEAEVAAGAEAGDMAKTMVMITITRAIHTPTKTLPKREIKINRHPRHQIVISEEAIGS